MIWYVPAHHLGPEERRLGLFIAQRGQDRFGATLWNQARGRLAAVPASIGVFDEVDRTKFVVRPS